MRGKLFLSALLFCAGVQAMPLGLRTAMWGMAAGRGQESPSPTVTVHLDIGSGEDEPVDVTEGTLVGELPVPQRDGLVFEGWYTEAEGGTRIAATETVRVGVTYYAHWTPADSGGGSEPEPEPDTTTSAWTAKKAVTLDGAVYDAEGNVAGVVQLISLFLPL